MNKLSLQRMVFGVALLWVCTLVACGSANHTTATSGPQRTTTSPPGTSSAPRATVPQAGTAATAGSGSTPRAGTGNAGSGPIVILSPTPVPGGNAQSQQAVLADRTLIINNVNKGTANAGSASITLTMVLKNNSGKTLINQPSSFQLVSSEGDAFGLSANATSSFFGTVASHGSRSGLVVFQVPAGAAHGLHLLYRSESATETVFLPLSV